MNTRTEKEHKAWVDLLTAASVNKRLLMRVLAHMTRKDIAVIDDEVSSLEAELRKAIQAELDEDDRSLPDVPLPAGSIPAGREEERRGHSLPNKADALGSNEIPVGVDHDARRADTPIRT